MRRFFRLRMTSMPGALLLVAAFACGFAVSAALFEAVVAGYSEYRLDFKPLHVPAKPILLQTLQPIREVNLRDNATRLRAYWHPSQNGSALVMLHGTFADHSQLVPEAGVLAAAGYGILLLDWPGHGQSEGTITWGRAETRALRLAVDYAKSQGVQHIGIYAFSAGAMIALHAAASDTRIEALALAGAIESLDWSVSNDFGTHGWLTRLPALATTRLAGYAPNALGSFDRLQAPVLLIAGDRDRSVPPPLAQTLFEHLRSPKKQLWMVHGADHGGYLRAAPRRFAEVTVGFFTEQLGHS